MDPGKVPAFLTFHPCGFVPAEIWCRYVVVGVPILAFSLQFSFLPPYAPLLSHFEFERQQKQPEIVVLFRLQFPRVVFKAFGCK